MRRTIGLVTMAMVLACAGCTSQIEQQGILKVPSDPVKVGCTLVAGTVIGLLLLAVALLLAARDKL